MSKVYEPSEVQWLRLQLALRDFELLFAQRATMDAEVNPEQWAKYLGE